MTKIEENVISAYGSNAAITLSHLGGNPAEIFDRYEVASESTDDVYDTFYKALGRDRKTQLVTDCYHAIRDEAIRLWLTSISRDQMLTMLNTVSALPVSGISLWDGEFLAPSLLAIKWSENHPEESPIVTNDNYLP